MGALLCSPLALAQNYTDEHPEVQPFVQEMQQEHGFSQEYVRSLLANAERRQPILDAISRPAERVRPWHEYRAIFITDQRIREGLAFWDAHTETLARAEAEYGVEAEVILAILGVETFYGRIKGSHRVIDALTTLGFDYPPRAEFFRRQLKSFLVLTREQQMDPLALTGSYAGAMGYPQFIPSSYQAFAVDFDDDGKVDIWNNPADAIGSVANYFREHNWQHGATVAVAAEVAGERFAEGVTVPDGLEARRSLGELRALGWQPQVELADSQEVMAFEFDAGDGMQYWLGLDNLYVITRYNRSVMYAMVVHQLAELLKEARQ
ncbi:MAG: lytic murein transglycosylase B [Halopseudomonas yangmingensis]|uniref:Membrane-bound lytic murein transglycosylase B n=1 Tax=Halopseudomonas yangmingensis TaxID=1720063 RepID=A0A1I4PZP2_9GAMM|nr:lytic murein transglycosylase B [Halopseudomonas yangmingensis]SFM33287.1 membrane-bound lytic murein transglycosylase B [Halopseudomonas yangmingensis]